jgi:quinol-cytochrome oxidoreductase complex cytochrome b subunit
MWELLSLATSRPVIVALAILGALMVTAASILGRKQEGAPGPSTVLINRVGYALTFASIALFIVAGFLSGR